MVVQNKGDRNSKHAGTFRLFTDSDFRCGKTANMASFRMWIRVVLDPCEYGRPSRMTHTTDNKFRGQPSDNRSFERSTSSAPLSLQTISNALRCIVLQREGMPTRFECHELGASLAPRDENGQTPTHLHQETIPF